MKVGFNNKFLLNCIDRLAVISTIYTASLDNICFIPHGFLLE